MMTHYSLERSSLGFFNLMMNFRRPDYRDAMSFQDFRGAVLQRIEEVEADARTMGLPPEDVDLVSDALCSTADTAVSRASGWAGQMEWVPRPLTEEKHGHNNPGMRFYDNLASLTYNQPAVVEIYILCLGAGFLGMHLNSPDTIDRLRIEALSLIEGCENDPYSAALPERANPATRDIPTIVPAWWWFVAIGLVLIALFAVAWQRSEITDRTERFKERTPRDLSED